jgi:DGQHR domain-containing protein
MEHSYNCFKIKQRVNSDIIFLSFIANAKEIYKWSHADSIDIDKNGVQRSLEKTKWDKIVKFFETHDDNIIPNNIILAFDEDVKEVTELYDSEKIIDNRKDGYILKEKSDGIVELIIDDEIKDNTYIIDGQHRLKGMSEFNTDLPIVVSLFININKLNRAFQFLTINNKASKVKTDNIKALISNFDAIECNIRERLSTASISAGKYATVLDIVDSDVDSPFYRTINWVNNRHGVKIVSTLAIENSLKSIQKTFPELLDDTNENKTLALSMFYNIWKPVMIQYSITLANIHEFENLFKKANIQAITEYICKKLSEDIVFSTEEIDITDKEITDKYMRGLLYNIPEEFWKKPWILTGLDNQTGRYTIIKDITKMKRNINSGKDWFEDLELYAE